MAVVEILKTHTSKRPTIMHLLRCLHFLTANWDIDLVAEHIAGESNVISDAISRNLMQVFRREAPELGRLRTNRNPSVIMGDVSHSKTRLDLRSLEREACRFLEKGLAPSTAHTYKSGKATYCEFCTRFNLSPLPASEDQLILFVADLAQTRSYNTIRVYLAAVRHLHVVNNFGNPLEGKLKLDLTLRGVRREKPHTANPRLPITPLILRRLKTVIAKDSSYTGKLLWAAMCTGFFGFMRSGEFTVKTKNAYDPARSLSLRDVSINNHDKPTMIRLFLRYSKTDQFGQGIGIILAKNGSDLCPVAALTDYLRWRGPSQGALFINEDNTPLTKQQLSRLLESSLRKASIDPTHYKGHSFRIGAATTASAHGIADSTIKMLGRWSSNTFQVYLKTPADQLARLAATMGKSLEGD